MSKVGHFMGAPLVLATLLVSAAASADRSHDVLVAAAAHRTFARFIVAQASHAPPGVPGTSDSSGASNGSHAPPPVPGSTEVGGGSSGGSHAPPPVPGSTNSGRGGSGGSHAPPPVPGGAALSGSHSPAPDAAGSSHAAPQVPMMGGNP